MLYSFSESFALQTGALATAGVPPGGAEGVEDGTVVVMDCSNRRRLESTASSAPLKGLSAKD
jgi:hypothetical protein